MSGEVGREALAVAAQPARPRRLPSLSPQLPAAVLVAARKDGTEACDVFMKSAAGRNALADKR